MRNASILHMLRRGRALFWASLAVLSLIPAQPVLAGAFPGREDPMLAQAIAHWLEGDETAALPALAALAQEGNTAAQMLLALIDKTPELQGPWLSHLSRQDRAALMRAPGGMSGRSWMRVAADASPLAGLFVALWSVEAQGQLVLDLMYQGEYRAAREAVLALVAREKPGLAGYAQDPAWPAGMRALAGAGQDDLAPGDPQRLWLGEVPAPEDLVFWLLSAPDARPIAALCETLCPQTVAGCALAAVTMLGQPFAVHTLGTPLEGLIANETFVMSARGRASVLRKAELVASGRVKAERLQQITALDACFADAMVAERARYQAP